MDKVITALLIYHATPQDVCRKCVYENVELDALEPIIIRVHHVLLIWYSPVGPRKTNKKKKKKEESQREYGQNERAYEHARRARFCHGHDDDGHTISQFVSVSPH